MKESLLIPLISLILIMLSACEQDTSSDIFYYDETGCSDAWLNYNTPLDTITPQIYEEWVTSYLESKNIEVVSFQVTYAPVGTINCLACDCKTGDILEVEVESGKSTKLRRIGFYQ